MKEWDVRCTRCNKVHTVKAVTAEQARLIVKEKHVLETTQRDCMRARLIVSLATQPASS